MIVLDLSNSCPFQYLSEEPLERTCLEGSLILLGMRFLQSNRKVGGYHHLLQIDHWTSSIVG